MIEDANTISRGKILVADICIVGAGAAGIAIALQFLSSRQTVLLLESGSFKPDSVTQSLYEGEVTNARLHPPLHTYRQRRFGGSTTIWGGRCVPMDPIDFEPRAWMPHSGWPIKFKDLEPYYPAANLLCEAGEFIYDARLAVAGGMRPTVKGFEPQSFNVDNIERYSCPTNFGARYRQRLALSLSVTVLLNANCVGIGTSHDRNRVERIAVATLTGCCFSVEAKHFVLAMGGLEIPRLLLAPDMSDGVSLGNDRGLVGRFYMCHLSGTLARVKFSVPSEHVFHNYELSEDGVYCRRRFALTPNAQREQGLGNVVLRLHHPRIANARHRTGALSAIYLARHFIRYEYRRRLRDEGTIKFRDELRHVANVAQDLTGTARFIAHWLSRHSFVERKFPSVVVRPLSDEFSLDFHAEQRPNSESRVELSGLRDRLGVPKLRVDWRYCDSDLHTVSGAVGLLRDEFARWGGGKIEFESDQIEQEILRDGPVAHHIGTARMSDTPSTGVVDRNCRVHSIQNLYIAGSAVFPTSGQASPTLTIIAMSLRLADHLKQVEASTTLLGGYQSSG